MKWLYIILVLLPVVFGKYEPNWESLDARPLPSCFGNEWFWWDWQVRNLTDYVDFMKKNYPPDFQYTDFAPQFTAEFFDPYQWADLFKASGAKYIVLTSKHHEGYTNWPSPSSWNWNSMDIGPKRDLVGDLATAIRNNTDIRFGLYHSLFEWFNPLYIADRESIFHTNNFVTQKTMPELYDLVQRYKPEVIWSDGQWEASYKYWQSAEFLAWLYNDSPVKDTVVTNDRWGMLTPCLHGGYLTCNDRYNPGTLQPRKWENSMTIDKVSYGFRRNANLEDYLSIEELLQTFVSTISCGGNLLMNIGPTKEGTIAPVFQERLLQMGKWLDVVGEAVYSSVPWRHQNDSITAGVWYTAKGKNAYAFFFDWPKSGLLSLGSAQPISTAANVTMVGTSIPLKWNFLKTAGISVQLNSILPRQIPNEWIWVLKLQGF